MRLGWQRWEDMPVRTRKESFFSLFRYFEISGIFFLTWSQSCLSTRCDSQIFICLVFHNVSRYKKDFFCFVFVYLGVFFMKGSFFLSFFLSFVSYSSAKFKLRNWFPLSDRWLEKYVLTLVACRTNRGEDKKINIFLVSFFFFCLFFLIQSFYRHPFLARHCIWFSLFVIIRWTVI